VVTIRASHARVGGVCTIPQRNPTTVYANFNTYSCPHADYNPSSYTNAYSYGTTIASTYPTGANTTKASRMARPSTTANPPEMTYLMCGGRIVRIYVPPTRGSVVTETLLISRFRLPPLLEGFGPKSM